MTPLTDLPSPTPPPSLQIVIQTLLAAKGWSSPIPLTSLKKVLAPACGGIYQVRFAQGDPPMPHTLDGLLAYVGQSGNLRRRSLQLRWSLTEVEVMPFTTPHVAAPCLWVWLQLHPEVRLQVSFFPLLEEEGYSSFWREGIEDLMLAKVRQDAWQNTQRLPSDHLSASWYSPLANFGYFPAGWRSSTDRTRGVRGGPLVEAEVESKEHSHKYGPDVAPRTRLLLEANRSTQHATLESPSSLWWAGYDWSAWEPAREVRRISAREQVGLYRLAQPGSDELAFVGHGKIREAAQKAARIDSEMNISSVSGPWGQSQLLAQQSDLCGLYLWQKHSLPQLQYGGSGESHHNRRASQSLLQPPLWLS